MKLVALDVKLKTRIRVAFLLVCAVWRTFFSHFLSHMLRFNKWSGDLNPFNLLPQIWSIIVQPNVKQPDCQDEPIESTQRMKI